MNDPNKLVDEFKKSGEFDRIRRELFAEFQGDKDLVSFKSRIEDVARQRLTNDHNLLYMPREFVQRELMQELERFPIVECSTSPMLNDPKLSARINSSLEKLLEDCGLLPDQERLGSVLQSAEGDEDSRSAPLGEGVQQLQNKTCGNNASANPGGTAPPASKQRQKKEKDPDSMGIDEDED